MRLRIHDQRRFRETAASPSVPNAGQATFDLALRMGGLVLAILLVALFMFIVKPKSFNVDVGVSVLRAMSSVAIMSLGLTLVIVVGEIDLSFGAMYGLGANSLAVMWILFGVPIYAALPLAIAIGALVGLFNGALVTGLTDSLVHRHARQLQSHLWRFALDHQDLHLQPGLSAAGIGDSAIAARLLHRIDREFRDPPDFAGSRLDARARARRRVPAASHAVRLPSDGDRREPGRGAARPPSRDPLQDPRLRHLRHARGDGGHARLFVHPDRAAEHRPLLHVPGFRGGHHRRRQPFRRQGDRRSAR